MASGGFQLRRFARASPPTTVNVTLRPTDSQTVDLSSVLSGFSETTLITCAVTGSVTMSVWPRRTTAGGNSSSWYKRELLDYLQATTSGASTGTGVGTWHLTASGLNVIVSFDVSSAAPTVWTIGKNNLAQYGGYPIGVYLGGTATNWSIKSQSTANAFTIVAGSNCVAWAGTYASATRTVGTPNTGVGAYTVTLQNPTDSQPDITISFTVNDHEYNIAPNGTGGDQQDIFSRVTFNYGDEVIWEDGVYPAAGSSQVAGTGVRPTQGSGRPAQPAGPYASDSWEPDPANRTSFNAGWITNRPRNPFAATLTKLWLDTRNYLNGALYLRFSRFTHGTSQLAILLQNNISSTVAWVLQDHNDAAIMGQTVGHDHCNSIFIVRNYIHDSPSTSAAIDLQGQDCQMLGNWIERTTGDAMRHTTYNSVVGSGKSKIWWNVSKDKLFSAGVHGDHLQAIFSNSSGSPVYYANPGVYEFPSVLGCIHIRGNGTFTTQSEFDGQGYAAGDINTASTHIFRCVGLLYSGGFTNGIAPKSTNSGSFIRQCSVYFAYGMPAPYANGTNPPAVNLYGPGDGVALDLRNTVIDAAGGAHSGPGGVNLYSVTGAGGSAPYATSPTYTNNVSGINADPTTAASYIVSPNQTTFNTLQDILDAFTPKAGGPLTVAGGASAVIGAIGSSLIDHRLQTYDASLLS